jgi:hypothetical protein
MKENEGDIEFDPKLVSPWALEVLGEWMESNLLEDRYETISQKALKEEEVGD